MHFLVEVGAHAQSALTEVLSRTAALRGMLTSLAPDAAQSSPDAARASDDALNATEALISAETDLSEVARTERSVLLLTEGNADLRLGGFPLATFEAGDIVSPHSLSRGSSLRCNFAIRVKKIPWGICEAGLRTNHELFQCWFHFVQAERELFASLTAEFMARALGESEGDAPMPVAVAPGETLIAQGDSSDEVFTLIEGKLEVLVDGVKVGQIEKDEIFGVISALADAERSASVVATSESLVLKLPKSEFLQLMRSRPSTVLELVRSMARALVSANVKVVSLTKRLTT